MPLMEWTLALDPRSLVAERSAALTRRPRVTSPPYEGAAIYFPTDLSAGEIPVHWPNFKALAINASKSAYESAQRLQNEAADPDTPDEEERIGFDYMECMFTAIIMAWCAIEAFANQQIADSGNKKARSVTEKLGKILPQKLNKDNPQSASWWGPVMQMRKVRNELMHFKGSQVPEEKEIKLWEKITSHDTPPHILAGDVIRYFSDEEWPWLEEIIGESARNPED